MISANKRREFDERKMACLVDDANTVHMLAAVLPDGRQVAFEYFSLVSAVLGKDAVYIMCDFNASEMIIAGENLGQIYNEICEHRLAKIQVFGNVKELQAGPKPPPETVTPEKKD